LDSPNKVERYDGIIVAVPHAIFDDFTYGQFLKPLSVLFDLHGIVSGYPSDGSL
jgi:hypothetical protein